MQLQGAWCNAPVRFLSPFHKVVNLARRVGEILKVHNGVLQKLPKRANGLQGLLVSIRDQPGLRSTLSRGESMSKVWRWVSNSGGPAVDAAHLFVGM